MYDYVLGGLLGASIALMGVVVAIHHIEAQELTPKGEVAVEAPSSPVEAFEAEETPEVVPEEDESEAPASPEQPRRRRRAPVDINLESDDPLEGIL